MFILSAVALGFTLVYMRPVLIPLVFAIFIYFASLPLIEFLEARVKLPAWLASWFTAGIIGMVSTALIFQLSISLRNLFLELNAYRDSFLGFLDQLTQIAKKYGFKVDQTAYIEYIQSLPISDIFTDFAGGTFGFLGNATLVIIIYFFLILGKVQHTHTKSTRYLNEVSAKVSSYLIYKLLLSSLTGFLFWLILFGFGVKLAVMFGMLAMILNFIPSIGSIIATLLPVPIIALQYGFNFKFFAVLLLCTIVQIVIGSFIDPKIIGKDLDLHPIVIILSLIFWGLLWGLGGAFLAVPLTASVKIFLSKVETTKKISEVLAGRL